MDVKQRKKKSNCSDPYKGFKWRDFPSAYPIEGHFKTHDTITEVDAMLLYGETSIASQIAVLKSIGYKFKYKRKRLGFRNILHEWTIIRD
jgi:hypothetical protein